MSVGPMSRTNLHCKITHLIVTQYTCSHHVVSKPRFSKYNYNSISNRDGHQPASHDTRFHANRGLATITKKRYKWRPTFEILERFSNDCRKTKTKAITPTNHDRGKQRDEPITIPRNYLKLAQSAGKITRLVLVLLLIGGKPGASLLSQSLSAAIAIT